MVASLGRRRTSTVNEGTARLNVVLDTAHRSADSSRRRRPCEAKRNKAIGDYRGDKLAISAAPVLVLFTALAHWEHAAVYEKLGELQNPGSPIRVTWGTRDLALCGETLRQ